MNWPDLCLSGQPSQDILREVGSPRILHICSQSPESWPQPSLTSVREQAGRPTLRPHPPTPVQVCPGQLWTLVPGSQQPHQPQELVSVMCP